MKFSLASSVLALLPLAGAQIVELHGSGTTNPSKCYWQIMDMIQTRTKIPTRMTYRGVGSSTGQLEFVGDDTVSPPVPDNDFGSGDIPLSQEDFEKFDQGSILHLPIVLGAISFFHSVPTGGSKLNLDACLLGKIFARDITMWDDDQIKDVNPGVELPNLAITVARRVNGSSSTASVTQYMNSACSDSWPAESVGKEITWDAGTVGCEGSGGMTDCIRGTPGTIGYIDAGHGIAEGLTEIELKNANNVYISSEEAANANGIMAAADNAELPDSLDGTFANVNLLNQPGDSTWPIVAMSYIYIRKDLTYLTNPDSQTLLKAFLKALYDDEYIPICEEEFGFFRVSGDLRDKALAAIDNLVVSDTANEWTFETSTSKRAGQGDYVISLKRESYSDIEQESAVKAIDTMMGQITALQTNVASLQAALQDLGVEVENIDGPTNAIAGNIVQNNGADDDNDAQVRAALALGSVSFILWVLAIVGLLVKFVIGA